MEGNLLFSKPETDSDVAVFEVTTLCSPGTIMALWY